MVACRNLPTIKYVKDDDDDCDLDPQSLVSDLLLDEGKAARDGADQRATIKVILEQGRAVREGSIAVGSQLDDPRFHAQHQTTLRPPVPTFPLVSSSLGKRPFHPSENEGDLVAVNGTKKARQVEVLDTQSEDSPLSSIEHDQSPELVQDTQMPGEHPDPIQQWPVLQPKVEHRGSPGYLQNIPCATADELEELPEEPPSFRSFHRHAREQGGLRSPLGHRQSNGTVSLLSTAEQSPQGYAQAPITPPTETATRHSPSSQPQSRNNTDPVRFRDERSSASASKFKRPSVYDFPDPNIDDSQMSPRSKEAQLVQRSPNGLLARIERLPSPHDGEETAHGLTVEDAIHALDNDSVFEGKGLINHGVYRDEGTTTKSDMIATEESENDIYEDAPTDVPADEIHATAAIPMEPDDGEANKENQNSNLSSLPLPRAGGKAAMETKQDGPRKKSADRSQKKHSLNGAKMPRKRQRKANSAENPTVGAEISSQIANRVGADGEPLAQMAPKAAKKTRTPRSTLSLGSPAEQLQSLQESARTQKSAKTPKRKAATDEKDKISSEPSGQNEKPKKPRGRAPKKTAPPTEENISENAAPSTSLENAVPGPSKDVAEPEGPPVPDQRKNVKNPARGIVVQRLEEGDTQPQLLDKTLPNHNNQSTPARTDGTSFFVAQRPDEPRKSPFFATGLTEAEIRIMKSREGMTREQYEAEKKRKQLEAKQLASEQKRREAAGRSKSATKSPIGEVPRTKTATPTPTMPINPAARGKTPENAPTNGSSESSADGSATRLTIVALSEDAASAAPGKSTISQRETSTASSSKSSRSGPGLAARTPTKTPRRLSSVKPTTVSKSAKKQQSAEKALKSIMKTATSGPPTKTAPPVSNKTKSSSKPAAIPGSSLLFNQRAAGPTIFTAKRLTDLHAALRKTHDSLTPKSIATSAPLSRSSSRPGQTRSALNSDSSDDDSESDSDGDSEGDSAEGEAATTQTKAKALEATSKNKTPPSSRQSGVRINGKAKAKTNFSLGRPDKSIRDKSVESESGSE